MGYGVEIAVCGKNGGSRMVEATQNFRKAGLDERYLVHRPFNKYHIKQMQIQSLQYHPFCISSGKQLVPC